MIGLCDYIVVRNKVVEKEDEDKEAFDVLVRENCYFGMAQLEQKHIVFNMEMSDYYKAKRDIPRFDKCVTTKSNAIRFFRNCAIMGQHKGLILNPLKTMQEYQWGLQVSFQYKNTQYHSIYIYYTKPEQKPIDAITKYILDNLDKNWLIFKDSGVDSNTIKQIYSTSSSTSKTPNILFYFFSYFDL